MIDIRHLQLRSETRMPQDKKYVKYATYFARYM
jgi:hypothetical protein